MKFLYSFRPITTDNLTEDYLFKESIKSQILAELLSQDLAQKRNIIPAEIYQSLVEETRNQLIQEIGKIQRNQARAGDYSNRDLGENFFQKLESQGYLEDVIKTLDTKTRSKIQSWLNIIGNGQSKGFLYGVGMAALLSILLPANGRKVQSMAYRTAHEGMDLIERARSIVAKVKEEIEDIIAEASFNSQQKEADDEPRLRTKYYYRNSSDQTIH